jgi:pimeloyl-ACP methyl ester carboxylesterase
MKLALRIFVVLAAVAPSIYSQDISRAQDISGVWQATIGNAKEHHRLILQIDKAEDGWKATLYLIDDSPDGFPLPTLTQSGNEISFELQDLHISFKGTLGADGKSIAGKMNADGKGSVTFVRADAATAWPHDANCVCLISFAPVQKGVKLEVLDWGGKGRPLVLLAGLGATAHDFDEFARKLAMQYHVYGITRRGYGDSSAPAPTEANYNADRLGDDVLAVLDSLHLQQRPVLVGHSIAGEELSSVGSRHPEKVAGLIYLDAAYGYAFYNPAYPDPDLDLLALRKQLDEVLTGADTQKALSDLLAELPDFEKEMQGLKREWAGVPADPSDSSDDFGPDEAILFGQRKYSEIKAPVLAIFANPHKLDPMPGSDAAGRAATARELEEHTTRAINALKAGVPSAHVVIIPNANHFVYVSNVADVLREINEFLAALPQ